MAGDRQRGTKDDDVSADAGQASKQARELTPCWRAADAMRDRKQDELEDLLQNAWMLEALLRMVNAVDSVCT